MEKWDYGGSKDVAKAEEVAKSHVNSEGIRGPCEEGPYGKRAGQRHRAPEYSKNNEKE